jgi:hypothetical protein
MPVFFEDPHKSRKKREEDEMQSEPLRGNLDIYKIQGL